MNRVMAALLLIAVLALGGGLIAATAYQAGLSTAVTTATADGGTVVTAVPPYGYGYGWGWHPGGFGFFGFLGTLLFLFLIFALLRGIYRGWPGRGWGPGGWGPGWRNGDQDHPRRAFWESRFGESFDEWHRRAHGDSSGEPPAANSGAKPV